MKKEELKACLEDTFPGFSNEEVPGSVNFKKGKVRDIFDLGARLLIVTTDRISAFDRILTTIPCKGEVLNLMALYWFNQTKDIMDNHILEEVTPRAVAVKKCDVLPVEVVVRGYLTGSAWRDYQAGKPISGIQLEEGYQFNQAFEEPLLTPSTKEEHGEHDVPISSEEVVEKGIIDPNIWREIEEKSLALFKRGSELAADRGLILVDTKYEFGVSEGKLVLVDEIHTPDSSRFWFKDTYRELFEKGEKQRKIDKEYLRQWLMEQGFMGEGDPPEIPDEIREEVAVRYIQAYENITGKEFSPSCKDLEAEKQKILSYL
jgi:phosphoribosylaminoimidazole-succinocarboxamide synthase